MQRPAARLQLVEPSLLGEAPALHDERVPEALGEVVPL
jgi:hypothetical protein